MAGFPLKIKIEIEQNPYNNTLKHHTYAIVITDILSTSDFFITWITWKGIKPILRNWSDQYVWNFG